MVQHIINVLFNGLLLGMWYPIRPWPYGWEVISFDVLCRCGVLFPSIFYGVVLVVPGCCRPWLIWYQGRQILRIPSSFSLSERYSSSNDGGKSYISGSIWSVSVKSLSMSTSWFSTESSVDDGSEISVGNNISHGCIDSLQYISNCMVESFWNRNGFFHRILKQWDSHLCWHVSEPQLVNWTCTGRNWGNRNWSLITLSSNPSVRLKIPDCCSTSHSYFRSFLLIFVSNS